MNISFMAKKAGAPPFPDNYKSACKRLEESWRLCPEKNEILRQHPDLYWALVHYATWRGMGAR